MTEQTKPTTLLRPLFGILRAAALVITLLLVLLALFSASSRSTALLPPQHEQVASHVRRALDLPADCEILRVCYHSGALHPDTASASATLRMEKSALSTWSTQLGHPAAETAKGYAVFRADLSTDREFLALRDQYGRVDNALLIILGLLAAIWVPLPLPHMEKPQDCAHRCAQLWHFVHTRRRVDVGAALRAAPSALVRGLGLGFRRPLVSAAQKTRINRGCRLTKCLCFKKTSPRFFRGRKGVSP